MKKRSILLAMLSFALITSCSEDGALDGADDTGSDDSGVVDGTTGNNDGTTGGSDYTLKTLSFEDEVDGSDWSSLIATTESYGPTATSWSDDGNTYLCSSLNDYYGEYFYNGGVAISNYYYEVAYGVGFYYQLSVESGDGSDNSGNEGSKNFAIVYDASYSGYDGSATISFSDNTSRVIDHLYAVITTYTMSSAKYGDGYAEAFDNDDWIKVTISGYDETDAYLAEKSFDLATGTTFTTEWTKVDLSTLGAVSKIVIAVSSSDSGVPGYVAIDDIAVRF